MQSAINTDNRAFCLYITIKCNGKHKFRCMASDDGRPNSKYADRAIAVNGERTIFFSFPVSPKSIMLTVFDLENPSSEDFTVNVSAKPLRDYGIWLESQDRDFLKLALYFSQTCGFTPAPQNGRLYATQDSQFAIKFFDQIRESMSGQVIATPARIGHKSGIIEVSKAKFDPYTIPMRVCILCHEYSHKYKNPGQGLPINDEVGADMSGLYMYLGMGFSKVDAIYVYANVFLKAQTAGNINRMRKIMDYIQRFENQEFAARNL